MEIQEADELSGVSRSTPMTSEYVYKGKRQTRSREESQRNSRWEVLPRKQEENQQGTHLLKDICINNPISDEGQGNM